MDMVGSQITHTVSGERRTCANALTKSYTGDVAAHTSARTCVQVRPSVHVRFFPYDVLSVSFRVVVVCLPKVVLSVVLCSVVSVRPYSVNVSVEFFSGSNPTSVRSARFSDDVPPATPLNFTFVTCVRPSLKFTLSVPLFFTVSLPVR